MWRKLIFFCLFVISLLCLSAWSIGAEEPTAGSCGTEITWTFDPEAGTLTLEGTGKMEHHSAREDVPWDAYRSQIKSVIVSDHITEISDFAFADCVQLQSMNTVLKGYFFLPESLIHIGEEAFRNCDSMNVIDVNNRLETVGAYAFADCDGLIEMYFPDSLQAFEDGVFYNCSKLMQVHLGWSSISEIPDKSFYNCSMFYRLFYPATLKKLGAYSFANSNIELLSALEKITIEEIGDYAFQNIDTTSFIFPESAQKIGVGVLSGATRVSYVDLPPNITEIPKIAFENCSNLNNIIIYSDVKTVGENAFTGCEALSLINYSGNEEDFQKIQGLHLESNSALLKAEIEYGYVVDSALNDTKEPETSVTSHDSVKQTNTKAKIKSFHMITITGLILANLFLGCLLYFLIKKQKHGGIKNEPQNDSSMD